MLETSDKMSPWRKIRLALIIIVDGVLIAHQQEARPTPRYVSMLKDLETFFAFPWGRESFLKTISCMKPPKFLKKKKCDDHVGTLILKLKQDTFRLQGFPLSLQLVAFRAIPQLISYIPAPTDQKTLMDMEDRHLPQHLSINSKDMFRVEFATDLQVTLIIPIQSQPQPGWGVWPNDSNDNRVIYLEQLIDDHHSFNKAMWPGGVTSEPLNVAPKARRERVGIKESVRLKQSLKPKPVNNKNTSVKKQRRISSYFTRSSTTSLTNEQLTEIVIELQRGMKQLHQLIKRKKKRSHGKQSLFHTLLNRSKKPDTPQNTDNPEPSSRNDEPNDQNVLARDTYELPQRQSPIHEAQPEAFPLHDAAPNDQIQFGYINSYYYDVGAMETDELPLIQSPIISQYGTQLHRHSTQTLNDHPPIHTPAVHTSPVHNQDTDQVGAMETDDTEMNTTNPNSPAWLEVTPKRYNFSSPNINSAIYDKSEHPNSPPFNHVILHGVRIYDPLSPDPSSPGPKFDSSLAPSSPLRNPLLLSPEPMTPLTSPNKSNDSLSGFVVHASTVNAFQATTSSNSPPCIGTQLVVYKGQESPSSLKLMVNEEHLGQDGFVDLTHTKDIPRHVPSMEENHLVKELFNSPDFPAHTLMTPLPQIQWDLFFKTLSANKNVSTVGIPTRCWCGANLTTYAAETKENLYRRFCRCEIAVQADVESYKRSTTLRFQAQDKHIENVLLEMRRLIDEQSKLMAATLSASPIDKSNHCTAGTKPQSSVLNIAAAAITLGTMEWLYVKLST
ncbi:unnamed protein product [Brassica napus]|uniref:(rape) hypothetical protein n=1 Tax=Brassica napus TaxID=3708 RepID=A0A816IFQ6_BRANA|nr:unnamed protein product [Brassica napus]